MPTPTHVKLLFDESQQEREEHDMGNWTVKAVRAKGAARSIHSAGICACIAIALIMFILGILIGAFLLSGLLETAADEDRQPLLPQENVTEEAPEEEEEPVIEKCEEGYPWREIRLPRDVEPVTYKLLLQPFLSNLTLVGTLNIDIKIIRPTKFIVLHAEQLNISSFSIRASGFLVSAHHLACPQLGQWTFELERVITPLDTVRLSIDYEGLIHSDLGGLYANAHITDDGRKLVSAVTQFEPTQARRMLPCFDEPRFKAVFEVSVIHEAGYTVRANMHSLRTEPLKSGLYTTHFAPSVKMSTYLLAIAVLNDFKRVRKTTKQTVSNIEINLFAQADVIENQTEFGLATGVRAMEYFESYFGIPYPLKKQDMLALDDFAEGAMENWGLTTFRDSMLLHNAAGSTTKSKETVALVVCHEYAHQWFGNLVTMKWWNDLWLNEGFANFMEYLCVEKIYPEWKVMDEYYMDTFVGSMQLDGFETSHAVSTAVDDPAEIGSIFDAIAYHKGSSIIGMIMGLTGKENFKKSLRDYLKTYAYSNAESNDLWKIIEAHVSLRASGISVRGIAEAWTTQVGYPVITASIDKKRDAMVLQNQTRFLFLEESRKGNDSTSWPIPVHYRTDFSDTVHLTWMRPNEENIKVELRKEPKWIIANAQSHGYYRVLYDHNIYNEFIRQLNRDHTAISAVDRAVIINDAFSFAKAGLVPIDIAMDLIQYLEKGNETDRIPWNVIIAQLKSIESYIFETDFVDLFQDVMRTLLVSAYQRLGWDDKKDHVDRLLQTEILSISCKLQIDDCSRQAMERFFQWNRDKSSVPVDLQPLVIEEGIKQGTTLDWERVYQHYLKAKNPSQKYMLLAALSATRDIRLIYRFMNMCLKPSVVRPNLLPKAFTFLMQNPVAHLHVWRFFRIRYQQFYKVIGSTTTMLGFTIKSVIENFNTQFDLDHTLQFFEGKNLGASQPKVNQALDSIRINIQWRRLNERALGKWLRRWNNGRTLL